MNKALWMLTAVVITAISAGGAYALRHYKPGYLVSTGPKEVSLATERAPVDVEEN